MNEVDLGAKALWSLIPLSILAGLATVFVFRLWTNAAALRSTINHMLAHMMEFRLFIDEPSLIFRAQRDLFAANWRLLKLVLRPTLILAIPFAVLMVQMDRWYGHGPLQIERPAVLTVQFRAMPENFELKTPKGIVVETPAVHVPRLNQISWRIRPVKPFSGKIQVTGGQIASIAIPYPSATILGFNWLVWFVIVSTAAALTQVRHNHSDILSRRRPTRPPQRTAPPHRNN